MRPWHLAEFRNCRPSMEFPFIPEAFTSPSPFCATSVLQSSAATFGLLGNSSIHRASLDAALVILSSCSRVQMSTTAIGQHRCDLSSQWEQMAVWFLAPRPYYTRLFAMMFHEFQYWILCTIGHSVTPDSPDRLLGSQTREVPCPRTTAEEVALDAAHSW